MRYLHGARKILVQAFAFMRALLLSALLLGILTNLTSAQDFSSSTVQDVRSIYSSDNNRWDCDNNTNNYDENCDTKQDNKQKDQKDNRSKNVPPLPPSVPPLPPSIPLLPPTGCDPSPDASPDPSHSCE